MSNLISRTSFLEATGSLFTSEKIATARTKVSLKKIAPIFIYFFN